ncbi:TetR/AcrR family transcriptional regulator [Chengkuizengella marina]|uniref:TetR/AcrR family transcriptional regulator n=1 Tax=Chengkuizengella marina TaxID=2507566 RepID=A0A6N9Q7L8_9BACL|nr:TetR/AcrR family transcriptional regulator [Chengkuizengella marina]NBI30848.1 TetR/AcrR family transcriptional regulator [Chengkuizengella marina]
MDLKQKIIKAAYELFTEKGVEKTTVSEIIELAGSSKGGFYHHFKSKDEILEATTMNYIDDMVMEYERILQEGDRTIIELLNLVFLKISEYKIDQIEEWPKMKILFSFSGNHVILRKLAEQFELVTTDCYLKLFRKGNEEGIFDIEYPEYLAGLWTREVMMVFNKSREVIYAEKTETLENFKQLLHFTQNLLNSTLGLSNHQINIKEPALAYIQSTRKEQNREG